MNESRILIAEDENIVAMDIQEALKSAQYDVLGVASTGREAVQRAVNERPDLVLMDIRMKGDMDGIQAARQIREQMDIPVIYLTAYSDDGTLRRAKMSEPYGYLLKPFERESLRTAIEMALHKHKVEKKLKDSERWLAAILKSTGDAMVATDAQGLITFMNPVAEALTGWVSRQAHGRLWEDVIRLGDGVRGPLLEAFHGGRGAQFPDRAVLTAKDGRVLPVDGSLSPTKDDGGRPMGFVWAFRDVTHRQKLEDDLRHMNEALERRVEERTEKLSREILERIRAEEVLQASESKFRSITESAADGIVLADAAGRIIYTNRGAQRLFGYSETELLARKAWDLMPERDKEPLKRMIQEVSTPDGSASYGRVAEMHGRDKEGREFPAEVSVATWMSGEKRFYAGILRDVSERRRAETNLRFQANILSQVQDAVVVTDAARRIVYWNHGAERLYGPRVVEAIGRGVEEMVQGPWFPPELEASLDGSPDGKIWRGEVFQKRKSGEDLCVGAAVSALKNDAGQAIGRLMVLHDVSERKRLQGLLLHSEKLTTMGQMAAGIAHQLKTPLGVIYGFAETLAERVKEEESLSQVRTIHRQAERCSSLVDNLLDFSRRQKPLRSNPVDLREAVSSAFGLVEPHALGKSVVLAPDLGEEPCVVRGPREMLEQVVINLCVNAVDAMPEGGTLAVGISRARKGDAPAARLEVRDTGVGMPEDVRKRIFEPFFTTKEAGRGTGLGLWLAKEFVSFLGGEISCSSAPRKGTVFSVLLPLEPGPATQVPAGGAPS